MGNVARRSRVVNIYCRGGGYLANFLRSVIFLIFQYYQNTRYLLQIKFIYDRCRRSSAAGAPVKYTCDSKNLKGTFAISKILLVEKLTNEALVTPTPDQSNKIGTTTHFISLLPVQSGPLKLNDGDN